MTWNSATTSVAIIASGGLATGAGQGTSNITAGQNGVTSPADVLTVTAPALVSIAVTPASPSIAKGLTQQFTATGTYTDSSTQNLTTSVTWNSATPTVAIIASGGLATGVGRGTSQITASQNGVTSPVDVLTVTAPTLQSIAVTPSNPSVIVGTAQQFVATGIYTDGTMQNLAGSVSWSSAATAVATITAAGKASGIKVGSSTISASTTNPVVSGSTTLTVTPLSACDVNQDGSYSVTDAQALINEALGTAAAINDLNGDHVVTVVDIQIVINALLNFGCTL